MAKTVKKKARYYPHAKAYRTGKGYVDPYVVRLFGPGAKYTVSHSWHSSAVSAQNTANRLNSMHGTHKVVR